MEDYEKDAIFEATKFMRREAHKLLTPIYVVDGIPCESFESAREYLVQRMNTASHIEVVKTHKDLPYALTKLIGPFLICRHRTLDVPGIKRVNMLHEDDVPKMVGILSKLKDLEKLLP